MLKNVLMPNNIFSDAISITREAAIACYDWIGKGKEKDADRAAVAAMRKRLSTADFDGRIVIGEGERDDAPMLYIGEQVGEQGNSYKIDIAVDPLEGTTLCALAMPNSVSVMALAPRGSLLNAPDVYMDKIAVGFGLPKDVIDIDATPEQNLQSLAKAKGCDVSDLTVCLLKRPRHEELITKVREAGARVQLITDGDIAASIATCFPQTGVDMYIGTGGAPEGVLAAAALKCMGGVMHGRLIFKDEVQKARAFDMGISDVDAKYHIQDMVKSDVIFSMTGVTDGWLLDGVKLDKQKGLYLTHSLICQYNSEVKNSSDNWQMRKVHECIRA